jgi:hypothetical protein
MNIFKGITKTVLSPLNGIKELVDDISGENSDAEQGLSILTLGASSIVKGTAKKLKEGIEDILD